MQAKKIKYSLLEKRVLEFIPKDGSMINTVELTGMVYEPGEAPYNARQTILNAINNLIYKSDENREPWEIFKSQRGGPHPVYFWQEKRKK